MASPSARTVLLHPFTPLREVARRVGLEPRALLKRLGWRKDRKLYELGAAAAETLAANHEKVAETEAAANELRAEAAASAAFAKQLAADVDDSREAAKTATLHARRRRVRVLRRPPARWAKAEHPRLWGGLRRAPEAMVSFQAAQAALWRA